MDFVVKSLSVYVGLPPERVRYGVLFFLSFPLAFILRRFLHYKYSSNTVRHCYCVLIGLLFCWICLKWKLFVLIIFVSTGYLLLLISSSQSVHIYSLIYAILGVSAGHIYRMITDYGGYTLDFTVPMMVMSQRVTYVAFSYHDGLPENENLLNEDQKKHKLNQLPSLLEYLSYNFCFLNILAGPTATYKEYDDFITGRNVTSSSKETINEPSSLAPVFKKVFAAVIFLSVFTLNQNRLSHNLILNPNLSYPDWFANVIIFCFIKRCQYYFSFLIVESICNAGGLGFNGFDDKGNEKWDLVKGVDVWKYEFGSNVRELLSAWNITTSNWIRRVVYERFKWYPVVFALLFSATWHGFYPGYYVAFLYIAIGTIAARKLRRLLWHRFQAPRFVKILYDLISTLVSIFCRDLALMSFWLLTIDKVFIIWRYYYFVPLIVVVLIILCLPNKAKY